VPGGYYNTASGNYSFAAGRRAKANHTGTFVWADSTNADFASTGANQFLIRAAGGVGIGTNSPDARLDVQCSYGSVRCCGGSAGDILLAHFDGGGEGAAVTASMGSTPDAIAYLAGDIGQNAFAGYFDGDVYVIGMSSTTGTDVVVDANGKLWKKSSSKRYKENIRELEINPEKVLHLDPVRFSWKTTGEEDVGLVAEDVEQLLPDLVIYDREGRPDAVKYDRVTIYLLKVMKDQQERISALEKEIADMRR
jgi:hypothetical protein